MFLCYYYNNIKDNEIIALHQCLINIFITNNIFS